MDKTDKILRQLTKTNVTATPVGSFSNNEPIIFPNHSGILTSVTTKKLYLDKASDTYLVYNANTHEIDIYVDGTIRASI